MRRVLLGWSPMHGPSATSRELGFDDVLTHTPKVLTNVYVPVVPGRRCAYRELGERESFDWALASAAVSLTLGEAGKVKDARIVLGAVARTPLFRVEASFALRDRVVTPEVAREVAALALEGAKPLAENAYKIPIARALVARALLAAAGQEGKK